MPYSLGNFPVYAQGDAVGSVTVSQNGLMTVFDCACNCRSREILRLAAVCGGRYVTLGVPVPENAMAAANPPAAVPASEPGPLQLKKSFSKKALSDLGFDDPESFHLIRAEDSSDAVPERVAPDVVDYRDSSEPPPSFEYTAPEQDWPNEQPLTPAETDVPPETDAPGAQPVVGTGADAAPVYYAEEAAPEPDGWTNISTPGFVFSDPNLAEACDGITGALMAVHEDHLQLAVPVSSEEPFPLMAVFCFGSSAEIGGREYIVFKVRDGNLIL